MRCLLSLFILLMGLFATVSSYAADAPQPALTTEDSLGPQVVQPIEFPHDRHAGLRNPGEPTNSDPLKGGIEIDCMNCHTYARRSAVAGIPPLQKCIGCHQSIESVRNKPRIQELFKYWEAKKPVPWKKVNDLPDFVRFNHERHIKRFIEQQNRPTQEACGYCHGDVKQMTVARRSKPLSMGWCASCHQKAHPVTAAGGTPVGNQDYWYSFQKPAADAAGGEVKTQDTNNIKAQGPNDCWQCHK
ncbi:MAG: cytochrome c3 family protein [Nitrosomonadales bacterium]|nr:cytochrome c3 family protein [Nitrosomonadales bacterium]